MMHEDDFRLRAKARKTTPRSAEVSIPASYKGFYQEARIGLVRGKAVSGRRTLMKPATPRTGQFNARGRGRAALERGIGPKQGWRIHKATGDRYRARRAIVKVRVVKLRNAKSSVSRGHLAYWTCFTKVESVSCSIGGIYDRTTQIIYRRFQARGGAIKP